MKKNVLTLSITAALVGIGFAGGAQAIGLRAQVPFVAATGTELRTSVDGIGQFLYVPYYTVQDGNNTLINIVNTDTVNGKAVKVRFRSAANSDDVLDFQVFLSPGDIWNAEVYKDATTMQTRLFTRDMSCTKPLRGSTANRLADGTGTLNHVNFSTVRLDPNLTGDALLNQAREGYAEVFTMADIPPLMLDNTVNPLYTAIKHKTLVNGTWAPGAWVAADNGCSQNAAFTKLDTDPLNETVANGYGLIKPTSGLFANWIIINPVLAGAWSGAATAINAVAPNENNVLTNVPGQLVYFPQTDEPIPNVIANPTAQQKRDRVALFTADPWLYAHAADDIPLLRTYDLPDFSVPYTNTTTPKNQVMQLSKAISTNALVNEWLTLSSGATDTDWILSMPTRRYSVAYDYTGKTPGPVYTSLTTPYFTTDNTFVQGRQVCVSGLVPSYLDQEERTPGTKGSDVIVSPQPPGPSVSKFNLCGEVSVLSFNNADTAASGALVTMKSGTFGATVARSTIETTDINGAMWEAGWLNLATPGLGYGLPVLGYEAIRANFSGAVKYPDFGATLPHRTDRIVK